MLTAVLLSTLTGSFTIYSGTRNHTPEIEAVTDLGPILEYIIHCPEGTAIITYSKLERLYCDPQFRCGTGRATTIRRACR